MDMVKEDKTLVGLRAEDGTKWPQMIRRGGPLREKHISILSIY